jgi:acyl-CoA thioesterase I
MTLKHIVWTVCLISAQMSAAEADISGTKSRVTDIAQRLETGETTRIVCFGDSITGAYYHTGGVRAWCDMLGLALQQSNPRANLEMINAGISGHTTVNALARIDQDVIAKRPHLVVVMFGMNDVTRVSLADYRENLRSIVTRCAGAGAAVVLCTPNSVYENQARPNSRLAEFSDAVLGVADELSLPLVDCFAAWQKLRNDDPVEWMLMMSDSIHPNMNGHRMFAELMTHAICGKKVSMAAARTPLDALHHTFDRLTQQQPVKLVAMPPYDVMFPAALRTHFPDAVINVVPWPLEGQSVADMAEWAKRIRAMKPTLVIPAVPATASAVDDEQFFRDYEWVLNWSFEFAGRPWDVVPALPRVLQVPPDSVSDVEREPRGNSDQTSVDVETALDRPELTHQLVSGKDVRFIDRSKTDTRSAERIVGEWVAEQKRTWMAARDVLPLQNDHVRVPAQSWPHRPGPRTVKASVYYPGNSLDNITDQTGIMLTLHNWGGERCAGTANPTALAERLNVIAVCVDYLQSGRQASVDDPEPYDVGYLQALDALRALAYVRNGLIAGDHPYDDGRIYCTGGSGGGNVTLMANKLAPHTFACVIDMCGMKKLSDDIAFNLPGGSGLNARWSSDPQSTCYLSTDEQEIRFVGHPGHLATMKQLNHQTKIVVVHGVKDSTCPFPDAQEMVENMKSADLDVIAYFIDECDLNATAFNSLGHGLGNRTEIVFQVAGQYLFPDGADAKRRIGPSDFERRSPVVYKTTNGHFVISFDQRYPVSRYWPDMNSAP